MNKLKRLKYNECPQFLDCKEISGETFEECPNKSECHHSIVEGRNKCLLPYAYFQGLVVENFGTNTHRAELIQLGWMWASPIPYSLHFEYDYEDYEDKDFDYREESRCLTVHCSEWNCEAIQAGWASAVFIPRYHEIHDYDCDYEDDDEDFDYDDED